MTDVPPSAPQKPAAPQVKKPGGKVAPKTAAKFNKFQNFLRDEGAVDTPVLNEQAELLRRKKLVRIVRYQNGVIISLVVVLLLAVPILQPTYRYYIRGTTGATQRIQSLSAPNMTNQAVLSWVTTAITEVMTLGFGDFEKKLLAQRHRFTKKGWESFVVAIGRDEVLAAFKERQLVLTTVPSTTPIITSQGQELDGSYQWHVEVPVIMTYATNNNVTKQDRAIIALVVTRVPTTENSRGVAIKSWTIGLGGK